MAKSKETTTTMYPDVNLPSDRLFYKTKHTYDHTENKGEINNDPSQTIPDQTMTISQIMERHVRGLPITGVAHPIYSEDNPFPDLSKLDLAEREEFFDEARKEFEALQQKKRDEDEQKRYEYYKKKLEDEQKNKQQPDPVEPPNSTPLPTRPL